jgi:hypothetical protein
MDERFDLPKSSDDSVVKSGDSKVVGGEPKVHRVLDDL